MSEHTYSHIDTEAFRSIVRSDEIWYNNPILRPVLQDFHAGSPTESGGWQEKHIELLHFFTTELRRVRTSEPHPIILGDRAEYFNDDDRINTLTVEFLRKDQINTAIVHHTAMDPEQSLDELNALGLLRLYVPEYQKGTFDIAGKNQKISSGHLFDWGPLDHKQLQVYWGYHFLVRPDGQVQRLLKDEYTGFHAGVYSTNCHSVGIALAGDYSESDPPDAMLDAVASVVRRYPGVDLIGHRQVVKKNGERVQTVCPGNTFEGPTGWQVRLLEKLAIS